MTIDVPVSKATFDRTPAMTGRDGAIDFAEKSEAMEPGADPANDAARFVQALGQAVVETWADLSTDDQERVFERAVVMGHHGERDEMLREQLAKFLHDRHKRTTEARVDREESSGR
jgi:hypothetical protein